MMRRFYLCALWWASAVFAAAPGHASVKAEPDTEHDGAESSATIDAGQLRALVSGHGVVLPEQLAAAPHIIKGQTNQLLLGPGDLAYARGNFSADGPSRIYDVVRRGQTYLQPHTGELLGLEVEKMGKALLLGVEGDVGIFQIEAAQNAIGLGDRLLPADPEGEADWGELRAKASAPGMQAEVLALPADMSKAGRGDWLVLDKGMRSGIRPGDKLLLYKPEEKFRDPAVGDELKLPQQPIGSLLVFQVFGKVSYGVVMEASQPVEAGDILRGANNGVP